MKLPHSLPTQSMVPQANTSDTWSTSPQGTTPSSVSPAPFQADTSQALGRLIGQLIQAPLSLLQGGQEQALAQFLLRGAFDQTQLLSDLRLVAGQLSNNAHHTAAPFPQQSTGIPLAQAQLQSQTGQTQGQTYSSFGPMGASTGSALLQRRMTQQMQGDVSLTQDGLLTRGGASLEADRSLQTNHQVYNNLFNAQMGTNVGGKATTWAQGSALMNAEEGLKATGEVGGRVQVGAQADAAFQSSLVQAKVNASALAAVEAKGQGDVTADLNGLRAKGRLGAKAEAEAQIQGKFNTAGLDLGGERVDVNGQARGYARAGARAEVDVDVAATFDPARLGVDAEAGAFAGAKAGVEGRIGLGEFASLRGEASAWAGAGAEAGVVAGLSEGKLRFGFHAGAAVKAGAGGSWSVEVDVQKIATAAAKTAAQAALGSLGVANTGLDIAGALLNASGALSQAPTGGMSGAPMSGAPMSLLPGFSTIDPAQAEKTNQIIEDVIKDLYSKDFLFAEE